MPAVIRKPWTVVAEPIGNWRASPVLPSPTVRRDAAAWPRFGYEAEHAGLSRTIAGQRLLPKLNEVSGATLVVTNSFSCRHQIADLSDRRPLHVMEVVREFFVIAELWIL